MKQEIERHLKDKETLENTLPSNIVIGPYWISTEGVKQALAKKRKALANAVIELLAKKLRKQADMVCNVFVWGGVIILLKGICSEYFKFAILYLHTCTCRYNNIHGKSGEGVGEGDYCALAVGNLGLQ